MKTYKTAKKPMLGSLLTACTLIAVGVLSKNDFVVANAASEVIEIEAKLYQYETVKTYRNGVLQSSEEYTYYDDGAIETETDYEFDETANKLLIDSKYEYKYENSLVIESKRTDYGNGEVTNISVVNYEYNEHGDRTICKLGNIVNGEYQYKDTDYTLFEYDAQGRMTSCIATFGEEKEPYTKDIYTYFEGGYFVDNYYYISDWNLSGSFEYLLNNRGQKTASYNVDGTHANRTNAHLFTYDDKGRLTSEVLYGTDNVFVQKEHSYEYLKDTSFITSSIQTIYNNDSVIRNQSIGTCEYDKNNRITSSKIIRKQLNTETGELEEKSVTTAEYTHKNNSKSDVSLNAGAVVGIVLGILFLLIIAAYTLGYFFLYRKGKLDDSKIKVIYKFLPRGEKQS